MFDHTLVSVHNQVGSKNNNNTFEYRSDSVGRNRVLGTPSRTVKAEISPGRRYHHILATFKLFIVEDKTRNAKIDLIQPNNKTL